MKRNSKKGSVWKRKNDTKQKRKRKRKNDIKQKRKLHKPSYLSVRSQQKALTSSRPPIGIGTTETSNPPPKKNKSNNSESG